MSIPDFIEKFICPNSLIRIWIKDGNGHRLLFGPMMEWEVIKSRCFESNDSIFEVVGVTDILCDTYMEAINIVVKKIK